MLYKRGKIYWCKFMLNGKLYRHSCQTKDKKIAEEVENAIRGEIVRGKYDLPAKYKPEYVFKEVFTEYIRNQSVNIKTIERRKTAAKHFMSVFASDYIQSVTANKVETYQLKRRLEIINLPKNKDKRESEISFRTVNIEIATLYNLFNYCIKKGLIDKNPAAGIKKLNELSRLKTLSDSDIEKIIAGATNKLTKDLITFLIYTGCRKGEALNLKWDDVDLQNNVIAIKGTKTKYDRYMPVSKPLKELLKSIEKNQDCFMYLIIKGQN